MSLPGESTASVVVDSERMSAAENETNKSADIDPVYDLTRRSQTEVARAHETAYAPTPASRPPEVGISNFPHGRVCATAPVETLMDLKSSVLRFCEKSKQAATREMHRKSTSSLSGSEDTRTPGPSCCKDVQCSCAAVESVDARLKLERSAYSGQIVDPMSSKQRDDISSDGGWGFRATVEHEKGLGSSGVALSTITKPQTGRQQQQQQQRQQQPSDAGIIGEPQCNDVLFGRGGTYKAHPGNRRMQLLADIHREHYDLSKREEKTEISWNIVRIIKSTGGRFLKHNKLRNEWVEVSIKAAREKVSHAMRDGRTKPLRPIDLREVEGLPYISDAVRRSALRMSSFCQQGAEHSFQEEEATILVNILSPSVASFREEAES